MMMFPFLCGIQCEKGEVGDRRSLELSPTGEKNRERELVRD